MRLTALEASTERGDLVTMYKLVNKMAKVHKHVLEMHRDEGTRDRRGHTKKKNQKYRSQ